MRMSTLKEMSFLMISLIEIQQLPSTNCWLYVWRQKLSHLCLQTMLLHWNTLATPISPHAFNQHLKFVIKLHHFFLHSYIMLVQIQHLTDFTWLCQNSLPKRISYMTNPFLYTSLSSDFLYFHLGFGSSPMKFSWGSYPSKSCSAHEHYLHLRTSCWFDNHFFTSANSVSPWVTAWFLTQWNWSAKVNLSMLLTILVWLSCPTAVSSNELLCAASEGYQVILSWLWFVHNHWKYICKRKY